jgi:membrane protein DedA with SNARE-associated domain
MRGTRPGRRGGGGRWGARDLLCAAAIVMSAIYALAVIPLTPMLIATHPVLLELLTGSTSSIVAAGAFSEVDSKLQLAVVVAAALPGMMRFDWVFWWAGRLWGHRIVDRLSRRSPRAQALVSAAERRGIRFAGPLVAVSVFLPGGIPAPVYAAAGWVGLPLLPFLIADAIGTAAWVSLLATFGYLLGRNGVNLADLVSRYAVVTICVLAVAAIAPNAWHAWRDRARPAAAPAPLTAASPEPGRAGK